MVKSDVKPSTAPIAVLSRYLGEGLIGRSTLIERLLIGLLSGGHLLVEGAPGLAKTVAVKRLANGVDVSFARIQCTPDLMPADLTGTPVFRPDKGDFEFIKGPLFHSIVLVDEINRAPPKVQSAMLEAMAEHQITAGGTTYALPDPFMVVATQNPIEHEGTFPLPEAQLDRFLMHVVVEFPDADQEREILDLAEENALNHGSEIANKLQKEDVFQARQDAAKVHLSPALRDYIVRLVMATRTASAYPEIAGLIEHPVSPRGSISLASAVKMRAYLHGRDHATPEDVRELAGDTLAHRMVLTWRAVADGETARAIIERLLAQVPAL